MKVTLPLEFWQFILDQATRFVLPEKLGQDEFDHHKQSAAHDEVNELVQALRDESHHMQQFGDDKLLIFGPENASELTRDKDGKITKWRFKDPSTDYTIDLSKYARNGVAWVLYVSLHPSFSQKGRDGQEIVYRPVSSVIQADTCWPIARAVKREAALRSMLKIDRAKAHQWAEDDDEDPALEYTRAKQEHAE